MRQPIKSEIAKEVFIPWCEYASDENPGKEARNERLYLAFCGNWLVIHAVSNVELTGSPQPYRGESSDRRERG